ncbi:hypothetical protein LPN04_29505 [Rugamonas sp. A1-17]|nr:hypothetical protein [Rugamonas sp. A1-17]
MNYIDAKQIKVQAETAERTAAALLEAAKGTETGPMGLTPDHVKAKPEFQKAWAQYDAAFRHMQNVNRWFTKQFKKEYAAERKATRAERLALISSGQGQEAISP